MASDRESPRLAVAIVGLAAIYLPLSVVRSPDLQLFLFPWLDHIRAAGPVGAFATPFSNYSPPYLYLLSAASLLDFSDIVTIKLLAIAGACWLAWCVSCVAGHLGKSRLNAAERVILLPTVILNSAVLGQCDALWTGCCILACDAALRNSVFRVAAWAGLAFAFKAQAAFLAPFFVGYLLQKRAWMAFALPPAIYLLANTPAALAGWPLSDLLTIYVRQASFDYIGSAPNLWAIPAALSVLGPTIFPIAYALGALAPAAAATWLAFRARDPLPAALASSLLVPFFLAKMLERFFFPADILSLVIAFADRSRTNIATAILVQLGSFLSIVAYMHAWPWVNAIGSLCTASALTIVAVRAATSVRPIKTDDRAIHPIARSSVKSIRVIAAPKLRSLTTPGSRPTDTEITRLRRAPQHARAADWLFD